jgi:hypothetical protein
MLGLQFDPMQSLTLINQRHAELIDEAGHERLVNEAMHYSASRIQVRAPAALGRLVRALVPNRESDGLTPITRPRPLMPSGS